MSGDAEVARLFARDASLWTNSGEDKWLGWIDAVEDAQTGLAALTAWAGPLGAAHERVVLCGMGGSSLAPLVIGDLHGSTKLHVLDSTDPDAVRAVPVEGSLFVIASKSGSTMEPNCFADAFWGKTGGDGSRFVAITDPGSSLEERAKSDGWAHIAHGRADVGGRYSALTAFGLVPAALAGIDIAPMIARASAALAKCHDDWGVNPSATLATVIGNAHEKGRDKLTFITSPKLASIGLWLEQLIAESTGKQGTGVLPVAGEPLGDASAYGADRLFVHLRQGPDDDQDAALDVLRAAGHPVFTQQVDAAADLGALFIEWEIATALVGARLHINPFDQPNVQEAKDRTVAILDGFAQDGKLPAEEAGSLAEVLGHAERGRSYVCLQAFVAPTPERQALLDRLQARVRDALGCAVTAGFGPRYLHSTGQYHKGGPPNGVFVQLLAGEQDDEAIPGRPFGFRTLRDAQALGDAGALRGRGLPARAHLPGRLRGGDRAGARAHRNHEDQHMKIAFVGLGRMGAGMTHRLLDAGHEVHAWNRSEGPRATLASQGGRPAESLEELVANLGEGRRAVWVMVPSGDVTEQTIDHVAGLLREGDILIDGGNSRFTDGKRRSAALAERGIVFVDAGTSGGVWGYQVGYCLMVGGPDEAIAHLAPGAQGPRPAATAGCTAARPARATSSRWSTTASSTASCRPTPRASRSCTRASTSSTRARSPSSGCRARSCARGCSSCSAWRSTPIRASRGSAATSRTPARAAGRSSRRSTPPCPAPVIALSLMLRQRSRQDDSYSAKVNAALRQQFGGHAVKDA